MQKNKKITNKNDATKKLVVALTEKIEEKKRQQIGGNFEKDGLLFKTKLIFNAKYISKYQYSQLFALYDFMQDNPKLKEAEIRNLLRLKPIKFAFLNKCDSEIQDFLSELKDHGPVYVAHRIESVHYFEDWARKLK